LEAETVAKDGKTSGASAYTYVDHKFDVVVVGAGGAGLRATLGMAEQGLKTACITKVFPTRSHTVAAQGGIAASLQNMGPDSWQWHMYDTVKGSDWLGDVDAMEYLVHAKRRLRSMSSSTMACRSRVLRKARSTSGRSAATCMNYGDGPPVQRTCAAADRTGHAILHTLYGQSLKQQCGILHRIFRARPDHVGRWHAAPASWPGTSMTARSTASRRQDGGAGDRRLRPRLFLGHLGPHLHG
jgi:succinate dehydrogenase / fumarate reductase flavoprotein subunit